MLVMRQLPQGLTADEQSIYSLMIG